MLKLCVTMLYYVMLYGYLYSASRRRLFRGAIAHNGRITIEQSRPTYLTLLATEDIIREAKSYTSKLKQQQEFIENYYLYFGLRNLPSFILYFICTQIAEVSEHGHATWNVPVSHRLDSTAIEPLDY